jgi:adenine deaminase
MNTSTFSLEGQLLLLEQRKIVSAKVHIENGKVTKIEAIPKAPDRYILPGFIDAHIHIESSMLVPSEFARMAVKHGTVASVSDPHEIANVLGIEGVEYMIENGDKVPFKFYFGAPSCVPATSYETAGAHLGPKEIDYLLQKEAIVYLAEMMNYPGVINGDAEVMEKISIAKKHGKKVDGHAPGLRGEECKNYISKGISTDHECISYEEGKEKIAYGMKVLIREGSAAKNFDALIPLLSEYPDSIMFCSDDKHPHDLIHGHINQLVSRAVKLGYDLFDVLNAAIRNPIDHYGLKVGQLRLNDPADFIIVEDLKDFKVEKTYINGELVFSDDTVRFPAPTFTKPNNFSRNKIDASSLQIKGEEGDYRVIELIDGQLITKEASHLLHVDHLGNIKVDVENDILKMIVLSRYDQSKAAIAFAKGFGFKKGAIASSVAHDSHNIIAVGCNDEALVKAINSVIENKGGISIFDANEIDSIPLEVSGLMSAKNGEELAKDYERLFKKSNLMGSTLFDPFMMLSFCALLVIPELKLSNKGLFNANTFNFVNLKKNN